MIINVKEEEQTPINIECGDVLYRDDYCFLIVKSTSAQYPYTMIELMSNRQMSMERNMDGLLRYVNDLGYKLYKANQVRLELL